MVNKLLAQFDSYAEIPQINKLRTDFEAIRKSAQETVVNDFRSLDISEMSDQKNQSLHDGCMVLDALGDSAKNGFLNEFTEKQLVNYNKEFPAQNEQSKFDKVERRSSSFSSLRFDIRFDIFDSGTLGSWRCCGMSRTTLARSSLSTGTSRRTWRTRCVATSKLIYSRS